MGINYAIATPAAAAALRRPDRRDGPICSTISPSQGREKEGHKGTEEREYAGRRMGGWRHLRRCEEQARSRTKASVCGWVFVTEVEAGRVWTPTPAWGGRFVPFPSRRPKGGTVRQTLSVNPFAGLPQFHVHSMVSAAGRRAAPGHPAAHAFVHRPPTPPAPRQPLFGTAHSSRSAESVGVMGRGAKGGGLRHSGGGVRPRTHPRPCGRPRTAVDHSLCQRTRCIDDRTPGRPAAERGTLAPRPTRRDWPYRTGKTDCRAKGFDRRLPRLAREGGRRCGVASQARPHTPPRWGEPTSVCRGCQRRANQDDGDGRS